VVIVTIVIVSTLVFALVSPVSALVQWRTGSPTPQALGWLTAVSAVGVGGIASVIGVLTFLVGVVFADSPDSHGHIFPLWVPVVGPVVTVAMLVLAYTAYVRRSVPLARFAAAVPPAVAAAAAGALWLWWGSAG
jgi:hypothetical protein